MSNRKYPRLGEFRPPKKNSGRVCSICGAVPAGLQFVEVNYMRGDDFAVPCCNECRRERKDDVLAKVKA